MEIYLDKSAVRQLRTSIADAIEAEDLDTLREDLIGSFGEDEIEEIERRADAGDFYEFVSEILEEWSADDVDEVFEILEAHLSEIDVDLKYHSPESDDDNDEDEGDDDETDTGDDYELDDDI